MVVVGNLLQFAGVSILIPSLLHHSDDGSSRWESWVPRLA